MYTCQYRSTDIADVIYEWSLYLSCKWMLSCAWNIYIDMDRLYIYMTWWLTTAAKFADIGGHKSNSAKKMDNRPIRTNFIQRRSTRYRVCLSRVGALGGVSSE